MSYNLNDMIRDAMSAEGDTDDKADSLEIRIREYISNNNSDAIYSLAEEWLGNHGGESADDPDYTRGVYRGMILAASEIRGW